MATINQTFRSGQEYTFSISQVPEISTDTAYIYSIQDTNSNLTARKINDTTFGLIYNGNSDTFTSNIQLVINGISGYETGLTVNFTVNGTLAKESVRIYNPSNYQISVDIYRKGANAPELDIYYCVGSTEGTYTHYTNSTGYGINPVKSISVGPNQSVWIYSDTMTRWANDSSSNYINIRTTDNSSVNNIQLSGNIMSLISGDLKSTSFYGLFEQFKTLGSVSENFLPATTLASSCYYNMFYNCSSLTTAPKLPATTLANYCYNSMFYGCTSLTTAPALPATTLAESCYFHMFQGCTSLTTAPQLPATTLTYLGYSSMFFGCTSLTTAPQLPATTLAYGCYNSMFYGCTSLTTAPQLPATTLAESCYFQMFGGCTSLTTAPALPATTLKNNCYKYMFQDCTSLTIAPELSTTTLAGYCYDSMFYGCTSLTTAPSVLPATTLADSCYLSMFYNCSSLTTAPALPATTLQNNCYNRMFYGCSSLTTAPELPATTLVYDCYSSMFYGCSNLNYIKALFTTTPSVSYTNSWMNGVASTGTFVKNHNATWNVTGLHGIPSGWTVITDTEE